jgi:hypothetical protein
MTYGLDDYDGLTAEEWSRQFNRKSTAKYSAFDNSETGYRLDDDPITIRCPKGHRGPFALNYLAKVERDMQAILPNGEIEMNMSEDNLFWDPSIIDEESAWLRCRHMSGGNSPCDATFDVPAGLLVENPR